MDIEQPYENTKEANDDLTVKDLKEMLKGLPDDYAVSFDSALGRCVKGDFTIYHDTRRISING
jgi:hypothetical protein